MFRFHPRLVALCAIVLAAAPIALRAQTTVIWRGGFPNDNLSVGTNWQSGTAPLNNGTETLKFTSDSSSFLNLDVPGNFTEIEVQLTSSHNGVDTAVAGPNSITIGAGGVSLVSDGTANNNLELNVPVVLSSSQTWSQSVNANGTVKANGAISGSFGISLTGDLASESFVFNSGSSTFTGGVTVSGAGSAEPNLVIGTSSTGPAGAPTSGPLGTGTLNLGDGSSLETSTGSLITLANPILAGDGTNGNQIVFGGSLGQNFTPSTHLLIAGPVTLNDLDIELDAGANSVVTFAGNLNGYTSGVCLDFGNPGSNDYSLVIVQGNITNVSRLDLEDGVKVILDGSGPSQYAGLEDIGTTGGNYLGLGRAYGSSGNVTSFLSFMHSSGSDANFAGTLGFDTTSGSTATFVDHVDLTYFTNAAFVGLGSATSAILTGTITPPGGGGAPTYLFGGGGGTLTVQSTLSNGSGSRNLSLTAGDAPLTLILSGTLAYNGGTTISGAALIFDTPLPSGTFTLTGGYMGVTPNANFTDANTNIQSFINYFNDSSATGVIGFDSLTGTQSVMSDIYMSGILSDLYLGTATSVVYSGTIYPNSTYGYRFAGVKGGHVTVSSNLTGSFSANVGLPNPMETFNPTLGYETISSVTLSGNNSYNGGTTLNSGYLFVTNGNSIGTGALSVPGNGTNQWGGTLAATGGAVALSNPIAVEGNGLAINTGSANTLTLSGNIYDMEGRGMLGIFGPVVLSGPNTYSGGTNINVPTSTVINIASNTGLGSGQINAFGGILNFTGALPVLGSTQFSESNVTFTGSPTIASLEMEQTTISFADGTSPVINGINGDSGNTGNVINLGTPAGAGAVLTLNLGSDPNLHGTIAGAGSLVVNGGNLNLYGANTYSGGTTIGANGTLVASSNTAFGTGPIAVGSSGALVTNTGTTVTNAINLADGGIVAGFGTFSPGGNLTFKNGSGLVAGAVILSSGGNSDVPAIGTLTFGGGTSLTLGSGGKMAFSVTDANGAAGTGYSTVSVSGGLTVMDTGSPFNIYVFSFAPNSNVPDTGVAANFNPALPYQWTLLSTGTGITGFSASDFSINTSFNSQLSFENGIGQGQFFVSQVGNDLMLNFTPVPEPSTWALMATGLTAMVAAVRRRRR